ncbi:MAG: PIG-L deacetylase family protein [Candidatus Daviesbacteria bacterium]|nr:PIG-L deacetylase family protein [Candidatus Daviesbacteria bacterium]
MTDKDKKIILAVGAHPDDIDIGCSGTIAKWIAEGAQVFYLVLTDGSKGSENTKISNQELIKIRRAEQQKAADLLGVKKVFFLDFIDGELENTPTLRKQIVKIIRQIKPTTVICWDPTLYYDENRMFVNHPDHRKSGEATLDCVYPFARNARTFPELLDEKLEPHVVEELLIMNFSKTNYFVDISDTIDKKLEALSCHKSQFNDIQKFTGMIRGMNKMAGQKAKPKMEYAEGFVRITLRKPS